MRFWVRLGLLNALVAVLPVLLTGYVAGREATTSAAQASDERLLAIAASEADAVSRWVHDQALFLAGFTQIYGDRLGELGPDVHHGLTRAAHAAMPSAVVVALVDEYGRPLVTPFYLTQSTVRPAGSDDRLQDLLVGLPIAEAARNGVAIGRSRATPTGPAISIVALAGTVPEPLFLCADLHLSVAEDVVASSDDAHGFALLDEESRLMSGSDHPLLAMGRLDALRQLDVGLRFVTFRYALDDGSEVRGARAPIQYTDLFMMVVQPASLAGRAEDEIWSFTRWWILICSAFALMLAYALVSSLADPIEHLRDTALAVAEGQYGRRANVNRADEIGELAKAFNLMSDRLLHNRDEILHQRDEIEAFNAELQDRVERRTRELRDAQEQLVRSGQLAAVAEIGAGLAHELNNPLAAILGLTQLLRVKRRQHVDAGGDSVISARALQDLEEQAERCREVVNTMLRFSAADVDPGKTPVVDLRDVLREAAGLVRGPFRQRGVELDLVETDAALPVRVDPVHATRILAQILNALCAGLRQGATVRVRARELTGESEVLLSPDQLVAVDERRDDWMASGMGLWVARRLLHTLGGRLVEPVDVMPIGTRAPTEEVRKNHGMIGDGPAVETSDADLEAFETSPDWRVVFPGV